MHGREHQDVGRDHSGNHKTMVATTKTMVATTEAIVATTWRDHKTIVATRNNYDRDHKPVAATTNAKVANTVAPELILYSLGGAGVFCQGSGY